MTLIETHAAEHLQVQLVCRKAKGQGSEYLQVQLVKCNSRFWLDLLYNNLLLP